MNTRPRLVAVLTAMLAAILSGHPAPAAAVSPDVVISQVYGGGGNAGATFTRDFIELYNRGTTTVSLAGWSVQYTSSTGTTWQVTPLTGSIATGGYYLIHEAQGAAGTTPLPAADDTGSIAMSSTSGKVALVTNATPLTQVCRAPSCSVAPGVRDFVGYGTANDSETMPTPALSNTTAALRAAGGATDTDHNANDFVVGTPNPRNSAAAKKARAAVVASSTNWSLADGLPGTSTIDFIYGTRPLTPLMGDWDGDGTKTVGTFEQGIFRLNFQNDSSAPEVVGAFGDPRGYPVAGDFDGNGHDDLAVYRAGKWEIAYLGPNRATVSATFNLAAPFGTGTWPNTIPVAGDWDGDGVDGVGTYDYATGTWVLKNTAGPGGPDIGPFVFWGGSGSYPVVGDFGGIGIDTPGYRVDTTWTARTEAVTGGATTSFVFGAPNSIPFTW